MRQTSNLGLALYDTTDKMNITGEENSLNHNMELLDAEVAKKMSAPESGTAGQVLTKTEGGFAWQDAPTGSGGGTADGAVLYTAQELAEEQKMQARANISAADAAALSELDMQINGAVTEYEYTDTYECTAGTSIGGDLRFFDLRIPAGTQYTFTLQQEGVFSGGIAVYRVLEDNSTKSVGILKEREGWSITAIADAEIRKFALYASADLVVGSGTITMTVRYSAETEGTLVKRMAATEAGIADIQDDVATVRQQSDELYAIINGTAYTKKWQSDVACTVGVGLSADTTVLQADIPKGTLFTLSLEPNGVTEIGVSAYAKGTDGNGVSLGMLKESEGYRISATAGTDIVGFGLFIANTNVTASGAMRLTAQIDVAASGALSAQVEKVAQDLQAVSQEAMRGSSVMGFKTLFYSPCYEIGATLNNDGNATYVQKVFEFEIGAEECVGVRIGAMENATAGIKAYVESSVDGTEYTQLLAIREAGVYHAYPPMEHTRIRVKLYPTTSGGLDEVTAKYREVEIFTSSDGRRRLAQEYAPRAWDVPAYYLRDGYMDGKVDEILSRVDASGGDCDVFFFTTDQHWRWNTRKSPALIGYLARRLNIERLFFGGDWADGYTENGILAFKDAFQGKIYHALGNHDYMNYWCRLGEDENDVKSKEHTPAMATFQTISRIDGIMLGDTMYGYYYVDNPTNKMRYIVLQVFTDESAVHLEQAQLDWLDGVLSSMPEGYLAVVFAHFLGNVKDDFTTELNSTTGVKVAQVCDKYASKVACMFNGHTHRDGMCKTDGGIPVFVTTCDCWWLAGLQDDTNNPRVAGTRTEQVIEVVIVDRTNHKVSAVRIGCPARVEADTNVEVREQTFVGS